MKQNEIRIIGGEWRGRKLKFPDMPGLRPTPNRVRETLFNWLVPVISGAHCLDLYCGSGALGLEALSRGADFALLIDHAPAIIKALQESVQHLKTQKAAVFSAKLPLIKLPSKLVSKPFDIVFLDPPFYQDLIKPTCAWLVAHHLIKPDSYIYIEAEKQLTPLPVPANWEMLKSKVSGQVGYHLLMVK